MVSKKDRIPQKRLPKPVLDSRWQKSQQKSKRKAPWYRHTAWFIPLVVCGIFVVLIAGSFVTRQVIIVLHRSGVEMPKTLEKFAGIPSDESDTEENEVEAILKSSKTDLEVLPPLAAKKSGRKLPKMLLVGRHPSMFQSLADAMDVAIGGDIIEIRDNGPLYMEPGKAVWKGKNGTLTIRGGKGFHAILMRLKPGANSGPLLTFGEVNSQFKARVILESLTILNLTSASDFDSKLGAQYALKTECSLTIRRCLFICDHKTLGLSDGNVYRIENCYFRGYDKARLAEFIQGNMVIENNLFVRLGYVWTPFSCVKNCKVKYSHNTFVHCGPLFAVHSQLGGTVILEIENVNNHFIHSRGAFAEYHTDPMKRIEEAQKLLVYRGSNNVYRADFGFGVSGAELSLSGLKQWQILTRNGEIKPILADPLWINNPNLDPPPPGKIPTPSSFALHPQNPAKKAATDGKDIGCDLSKIPIPPPMLENLVKQILQKK